MAENILADFQYSVPQFGFTDWSGVARRQGEGPWENIPADMTTFKPGTRLRMKPTYHYVDSATGTSYSTKAEALSFVSDKLDSGRNVVISPIAQPSIFDKKKYIKLQYRATKKSDWIPFVITNNLFIINDEGEFRIRPDHYYEVTTIGSIIVGNVTFHDMDKLTDYVTNRLRTQGLDFTVRKVKYV